MPGMPGAPGSAPAAPPPAEPILSNYMTLDPSLKNLLDRLELMKLNPTTKQKEVTAVVSIAALVAPIKPMITTLRNQQLVEQQASYFQRGVEMIAINNEVNKVKAVGGSLALFNRSDANLSIAMEMVNRRDAEAEEKATRPHLKMAREFIKTGLGLTITSPAPARNQGNPGFPGPGGLGGPGSIGGPGGIGMPIGPGGRPPIGPTGPTGGSSEMGPGNPMGPGGNPGFPRNPSTTRWSARSTRCSARSRKRRR